MSDEIQLPPNDVTGLERLVDDFVAGRLGDGPVTFRMGLDRNAPVNERWKCWRDESHEVGTHPVFGWPQCVECHAGPAYHERGQYLPEGLELDVYVPCEASKITAIIDARSGIVGLPQGERVSVYYEGWKHGAMQYADRDARGQWEAGVFHAADRMVTGYPTSAQASVRPEDLHRVGSWNPRTHQLTVDDERMLTAWLDTRD